MPDQLLLTTAQVCERLNIGKTKFFELSRSGELETVRIGSARLTPADAVGALVARLRQDRPAVAQLVEIIDEHGRIDVARIPGGTTLGDLEAAKRIVSESLAGKAPDAAA